MISFEPGIFSPGSKKICHFRIRIHPDDIPTVLEAFAQILQNDAGIIQYRHRHKNGSWVWLESRGSNQLHNPNLQGILIKKKTSLRFKWVW
jgi:hypothetical protein